MPRNVKGSDDEYEPKTGVGWKTRAAVNSSVLDSPLRRSSRIKQPAAQDGSSPDSPSDSSSVTPARGARRRTTTGEPGIMEPARSKRTRRNSVASDVSELTETESLADGPPKRVTRRSVASVPAPETPTKLNGRTRRTTRAGSESKTSPTAVRTTRRTRATSLEPEGTEEQQTRASETPVKSRRRASVLPSEPAVAEESEDSGPVGRRPQDAMVFDIVEEESDLSSHNTLNSSRRRSKSDANKFVEPMEIDDDPVEESEGDRIDKTTQENVETVDDTSNVPENHENSLKVADLPETNKSNDEAVQSMENSSRELSPAQNLAIPSTNKQEKSPGNKENEILNDSIPLASANVKSSHMDIRYFGRKSMNSIDVKPSEKHHNVSLDERLLSNSSETPKKIQENVTIAAATSTENLKRKERYSVDECVVLIEPMEIIRNDKIISTRTSDVQETPESQKKHEEAEPESEATQTKRTDCELSVEDSENTGKIVIDEDIATNQNDSKISSPVTVDVDEEHETKKEELEIIEISAVTEDFNLQMDDTSDAVVEEPPDEDSASEKQCPQSSIINDEPVTLITADNIASNVEKPSTENSSTIIETVDTCSSVDNEKPIKSDENEENILFAKDNKSSIVAESSTSGAKADEEVSRFREEEPRRKSVSSRRTSRADDGNKENNENALGKKDGEKKEALASDDESEYEGYPAFKDIAADEWPGGNKEESKKNEQFETNSVHSVSTERIESECDLELVVKEVGQGSGKEDQGRSDYDSDDTVKIAIATTKSIDRNDDDQNLLDSQETPMEVSSDAEEEEVDVINVSVNDISKKRASLNSSRKSIQTGTPPANKSISVIANTSAKSSPVGLNASRNLDYTKTSGSVKNTPSNKEKRSNESATDLDRSGKAQETDGDGDLDKSALSTPIEKKLKGRLSRGDARNSLSSKNNSPATPKIDTERLNRSGEIGSAWKSLDKKNSSKIAEIDADLDCDFETEELQDDPSSPAMPLNKSRKSASPEKSKTRRSKLIIEANSDSENDSVSPKVQNEVLEKSVKIGSAKKSEKERLNRSGKIDSARKSLNEKNSSKIVEADDDPDSNVEIDESQDDRSIAEIAMNKSRKSTSPEKAKTRRSKLEVTPNSDSQNDLASPEAMKEALEKSVKIGSAKKSSNKNNRTIALESSDSEIEATQNDPTSPETDNDKILEKSVKSGSAKKSANKKNTTIPLESSDSEIEATQNDPTTPVSQTENIREKSVKFGSAEKSGNKNASYIAKYASSDSDGNNDNSQDKLDNLAKIGSAKKSAKKLAMMSTSSSDSAVDDDNSQKTCNKSLESLSPKKSLIDKNYSTIAQVNSDSEVEEDVQSDDSDDADISRKIPRFLFNRNGNNTSSSSNDDSSESIDSDIAKEMNLDGKSVLEYSDDNVPADDCLATESESSDEDDDGADLADFVVDDDEDDDDDDDDDEDDEIEVSEKDDDSENGEMDVDIEDDGNNVSSTMEKKKPRKRIIPRPATASDADDSDELEPNIEPNVSSTRDKSATTKTPTKTTNSNNLPEIILEPEAQSTDLNVSAKRTAANNKKLLIQSSTPKPLGRNSLLVEKLNSSKSSIPKVNLSMKSEKSSAMFETSLTKKLSKSVCENIETPTKLGSSFKAAKTPKASVSIKQQLQTSLPVDLNDSSARTNLLKVKSTKISTLNQTVAPAESESPEKRFLMKEKLNDSMPALKLQRRSSAVRRSMLDKIGETIDATDEIPAEVDEINEISMSRRMSSSGKEAASDPEASIEKKKKKKKKKKKNLESSTASENPEETATSFTENIEESNEADDSSAIPGKKAKKLKKKKMKPTETPEPVEELEVISKKKKRKMEQEQIIENVETAEPEMKDEKKKKKNKKLEEKMKIVEVSETDKKEKKKKKKKDQESTELTEPEVATLRPKSRRIAAAQNRPASDSDDAPEAVDFAKARDAALRDLRKVAESVKASQEANKKKNKERESSRQERKMKESRPATSEGKFERTKTSVKRLPDDVIESLADVPERPKKKRKVSKDENIVPSTTMFVQGVSKPKNLNVDDGYIPLSSVGGTTQFSVINLKKAAKQSKKSVEAMTFRERMLARNPRQPVSAYLMYLQKQKASNQGRPY